MITLTFIKNRSNTKFYWEDTASGGNTDFHNLLQEAKRIIGARIQTTTSNNSATFVIKETTEEALNKYLMSKNDTIRRLVAHCILYGIDIDAPDSLYLNFSS